MLFIYCLLLAIAPQEQPVVLIAVVLCSDLTRVRALLAAGVDTEATFHSRWTALQCAARHGRLECLQLLLAAGADVEAKDVVGRTPLHHAAIRGELACLEALLAAGADKEAKDTRERRLCLQRCGMRMTCAFARCWRPAHTKMLRRIRVFLVCTLQHMGARRVCVCYWLRGPTRASETKLDLLRFTLQRGSGRSRACVPCLMLARKARLQGSESKRRLHVASAFDP